MTLADVARKAGVSTGLASRVLNNKMVMPIPQSTIDRIKRAAEELDYRPNTLARALITGKTHTIGLCYHKLTDPHCTRMLEAVEKRASELGYHLLLSSEPENLYASGRTDGVISIALPTEAPNSARRYSKPTTFIYPRREPHPGCVTWSDFEGGRLAAQRLLDLGHRHIVGLLGDAPLSGSMGDKIAGVRAAVETSGAECREVCGTLSADQIENGYLLIRRLLTNGESFTAIVARNDFLAVGALQALREAGLSVPGQVSVVGYNDTVLAQCAVPLLTSVRTPFAEAGVLALEKLVEALHSGETEFPGIMLPITLIERNSCAPPPEETKI